MRTRRWTDEQLADAVARSRSVYQVFKYLGLKVGGGTHAIVKHRIKELKLDTSHFTGQGWNVGDSRKLLYKEPRPLDEILVESSLYQDTNGLKRRLIREGRLENHCYECGAPPEWRGKPLVMRLDHVNGNRLDNRITNLRLLCPNCDSQTPTFAGRNKRKHAIEGGPGLDA